MSIDSDYDAVALAETSANGADPVQAVVAPASLAQSAADQIAARGRSGCSSRSLESVVGLAS